jgi:hypothetical protein
MLVPVKGADLADCARLRSIAPDCYQAKAKSGETSLMRLHAT